MRALALLASAPRVGETPAAGFAPIFPEWNVWQVWGSDEPNQGLSGLIFNTGLSLERQLQIWVENAIEEGAPGVAVADPLNPAALRGDQIQLLPNAGTLAVLVNRASAPSLAGALQLGDTDSKAILYTVRFYNRGTAGLLPWPHDENYVLENVFQPDPANPLTSGPAPSSLAGSVTAGLSATAKTIAIVGGVVLGGILLIALVKATSNGSRQAA
jgi:hypothetical protein